MLRSALVVQGWALPLRRRLQGDKEVPEGWCQRPAEGWGVPEGHRGQHSVPRHPSPRRVSPVCDPKTQHQRLSL